MDDVSPKPLKHVIAISYGDSLYVSSPVSCLSSLHLIY